MSKEKYVMIVEHGSDALKKNESLSPKSGKFLLNGIFTEFDIENRNRRFYNAQNFIPVMNSLLEKRKTLGVLFGEFDHPDVFDIAGKNASHAIESLTHNESSNRVDGSIALLSTHWGKEARAIINDGYPLFVSSRAAGVTDGSGQVMLKELFTYDIVLDPGFASAQVSVNESYGFKNDDEVKYRIYEMNDSHVNTLTNDNKNDRKTGMDLKQMEIFLADTAAKLEHKIMESLTAKIAPEEILTLKENYETVQADLVVVKEFLEFFKTKVNYLIKQNSTLVAENSKLVSEINENTAYSNHIVSQISRVNNYVNEIENRLGVTEKMTEYVANHTQANILFTESVAKETELTQKFAENIAKEIELTQLFTESIARETEIAQRFVEHVATEANKDAVFLSYIAEKVDGIVGYNTKLITKLKASTPLNEAISDEDSIQTMETPTDYLGLDQEQEVSNNIENSDAGVQEVQPVNTDGAQVEPTTDITTEPIVPAEPVTEPTTDPDLTTPPVNQPVTEPIICPQVEPSMGTSLLSSLVKILGGDETGIVMEITPDNKVIIQKSGTEELTAPMTMEQIEVINTEDNIAETVGNILAEAKKQRILANAQPNFFEFLSEQQIADFKGLPTEAKDAITLALNEATYTSAEEILAVIGKTINNSTLSYEEKVINAIPAPLKEAWNTLDQTIKSQVITESKYFVLTTSNDLTNFWNTRTFAKAVISPEAILIKESYNNQDVDTFNEDYINSFIKTYDKLK